MKGFKTTKKIINEVIVDMGFEPTKIYSTSNAP